MKGLTLYLNDLEIARKWATDEQLGRFLRIALESAENEIIPTFDNMQEDMLFDGFKKCLEKGITAVNAKRGNGAKGGAPKGNQNARKIIQKEEIKPQCANSEQQKQKRIEEDDYIKGQIERNLGGLTFDSVRKDLIKECVKSGYTESEAVEFINSYR